MTERWGQHLVARFTNRSAHLGVIDVRGSRILLVGVAYKTDIVDTWESPALDIMNLLGRRGGVIWWCDPRVDDLPPELPAIRLEDLTAASLEPFDVAVVM